MTDIGTPWIAFDSSAPGTPAELLDRIRDKTADTWVTVEPMPAPAGGGRFRHKPADSPYSATMSPYAADEEPHVLLYLVFPKGARFSERVGPLPDVAQLDDDGRDDATLRVPLATPSGEVAALAIGLLRGCSGTDLGSSWRAGIGDTTIPRQSTTFG
ncbi:MAG TPA: hypothetical protein VMV17_05095 [Streptosporangiaceae bacterium]|nr:hypothetical protein [Streptosporangiaceae bacterium]